MRTQWQGGLGHAQAGHGALRAALDEYLGNVRRGPSWSRLLVQYFGDQALQVLGRGR